MVSSYKWWWFVAGFCVALNAFDMVATVLEARLGIEEANPFMGIALAIGLPVFVLVKLAVGYLFVFLANNRKQRYAKAGLMVGLGVYLATAFWHFYGLLGSLL